VELPFDFVKFRHAWRREDAGVGGVRTEQSVLGVKRW